MARDYKGIGRTDTWDKIVVTQESQAGKTTFPTLLSSMGQKLWLGNQKAFSGDYYILEDL
jgi:DNA (cytosine-5)-methyltransferase 1